MNAHGRMESKAFGMQDQGRRQRKMSGRDKAKKIETYGYNFRK